MTSFFSDSSNLVAVAVGATTLIVALVLWLLRNSANDKEKKPASHETTKSHENGNGNGVYDSRDNGPRKRKISSTSSASAVKPASIPACVVASYKGHGDTISDFDISPNGCHIASCSPDRALFLWSFDDLTQQNKQFTRINVELDEAMHISFSPDSKAFVASLKSEMAIQVFKLNKKAGDSSKLVPTPFNKYPTESAQPPVGCEIAANGRFYATLGEDSCLKLWNLKGVLLTRIDSQQGVGSGLVLSRLAEGSSFVATMGFTSEARIYEVVFDNKTGEFVSAKKVFVLGGHSCSVVSTAFSFDNKRAISVSKDGVWRLWNIDVDFRRGQDPKLVSKGQISVLSKSKDDPVVIPVVLSTHAIILAHGDQLFEFDSQEIISGQVAEGRLVRTEDLSGAGGSISRMRIDTTGEYALLAIGKAVLVCRLYGELQLRLVEAEANLKAGGKGAMAERLAQQIQSLRSKLDGVKLS